MAKTVAEFDRHHVLARQARLLVEEVNLQDHVGDTGLLHVKVWVVTWEEGVGERVGTAAAGKHLVQIELNPPGQAGEGQHKALPVIRLVIFRLHLYS